MSEGLVLGRRWKILLVNLIHPVLLAEVMIDKNGRQVMIIPADIPADGCLGPGFFPLWIIGEAQEKPDDGDEKD